jgi:hypothetical protein
LNERLRGTAVAAVAALPFAIAAALGAVRHGPSFHRYADQRAVLGIPHGLDVLSNLPFIVVGVAMLVSLGRVADPLLRRLGRACAVATVAVGLGSAAYHVAPSDASLVLDWAPIAVLLVLLDALVIADRASRRLGMFAAVALPLLAIASVLAWYQGGGTAGGDMRGYLAVQAMGVALVPALLLLYPRGALRDRDLWLALAGFAAMRGLHAADGALLAAIGVSGHSLKHVVAALAAALALRSLPTPANS